jgi:hypothetical protein
MKRAGLALVFALVLAAPGAAATDLPDVTSRGGLRIGSVLVPWGNAAAVEIKGAEAIQAGPQACAFNATYEMTNLGGAATTAPFVNRLRVDRSTVVATNSGLALARHETKSVATAPYLPAGEHTLELSLDDDGNVSESNEANNRFKATYRLTGPCGAPASPPKAPSATAPARR